MPGVLLFLLLLAAAVSGGAILSACTPSTPPATPTTTIPGQATPSDTDPAPNHPAPTVPGQATPSDTGPVPTDPAPTAPGTAASDAPTPSNPPSAATPTSTPDASFTVKEPRDDAIAVAEGSQYRVEASTLTPAQAGVTYVVHAACQGSGWMRYRLVVDDIEVSASRLRCGREVVNTAFTAEGGERVQLHLDAPAGEEAGSMAEVVPAS